MTIHNGEKQCINHCPVCGEQDIKWSRIEDVEDPYQSGVCNKCGCEFDEVYKYCVTTFVKNKITPAEQLAVAAKAIVDDFDMYGESFLLDNETLMSTLRMAIKKYEAEQK